MPHSKEASQSIVSTVHSNTRLTCAILPCVLVPSCPIQLATRPVSAAAPLNHEPRTYNPNRTDRHIQNQEGLTALSIAAGSGDNEVAQLLLDGSDLQNEEISTALSIAVKKGRDHVVRVL
jgi:hypothetical protein